MQPGQLLSGPTRPLLLSLRALLRVVQHLRLHPAKIHKLVKRIQNRRVFFYPSIRDSRQVYSGFRILIPCSESIMTIFLVKSLSILAQFFLYLFKNIKQKFFPFCCFLLSGIRDLGSGTDRNRDPQHWKLSTTKKQTKCLILL